MKRACLMVFFSFCICFAKSQLPDQYSSNKDLVIHIQIVKSSAEGSGFLVGSFHDTAYIVTAGHVLETRDKLDKQDVQIIIGDSSYPGIVAFTPDSLLINDARDIALVKALIPQLNAKPIQAVNDPSECEGFHFFKSTKDKSKFPKKGEGSFEYWIGDSSDAFLIYLKGIVPGDSGSALFYRNFVAGMIVSDQDSRSTVVNIKQIEQVLSHLLPRSCQFKYSGTINR